MARREDFLLTRLLLTDGTISFEELSSLLLKWDEDSPRSLLQIILEEKMVSEEEGQGLQMCIKKLLEKEEPPSSLVQLDSILCQLIIKRKLASPEMVNDYQRRTVQKTNGLVVSESLLRDGHIPAETFMELKRAAERIYYRRRILAIARGQERLANTFRSPSRELESASKIAKASTGIQQIINNVKADTGKRNTMQKRKRSKALPKNFGKYEIMEEIASGGMGTVYKAKHLELGKIVALKVLHEEEETPDRIKRFLREADAAGRLKHPNIVGIYDAGAVDDRHYFSMDLIDGVPLSDLIRESKNIELEDFLNIAVELIRAVDYAHKQGIIHRDIKPANILIDIEGHPQVTDFGLAKIMDTVTRLTKSDTIIGTPFYMAPEQTRGENDKIGPQTDIWALGVLLYEMVTKRLPFTGRSSIELYHKINHDDPMPPHKLINNVPKEIEYIINKAMAKEPEDRYIDCEQMADDIEKYLDGQPINMNEAPMWCRKLQRWFRHNHWLVIVGILAMMLGCLCALYLFRHLK